MRTIRWRNGQWAERIAHAGSGAVRLVPFSAAAVFPRILRSPALLALRVLLPLLLIQLDRFHHGLSGMAELRDVSKRQGPKVAGKRRQVPAAPPGAHTRTTAGRGLPHAHPTPQPDPPWPCDEPRPTGAPPAPTFRSPYIATPGRVQEVGLVGGNARSGGRQAGGRSLCPLRVDRQVGGVAPRGAEICGGPARLLGPALFSARLSCRRSLLGISIHSLICLISARSQPARR